MDLSQPIPIPIIFGDDIAGFTNWSNCWVFTDYSYEPSYWMLLKREGFNGGIISDSSELDGLTASLDREDLTTLYRIHHKTDPNHYFTISLREEVEELILSSRIKVFKLDKDLFFRLTNPNDVLYSSRHNTPHAISNAIVSKRNQLAEEFGQDIASRWLEKDKADQLHWDRWAITREAIEVYDVGAEIVDTGVDFIVSVYEIGKAVVTIVGNVVIASIEFQYHLATGDIQAVKDDLTNFGIWVGDAIQSAQDLIDLAKKGLAIFNQLNEDPETRDLVIDYFSSLYESIPYRDSRTIGIRIVAEIGIEVLLALATAGAANVARRVGQVGIKATRVGTAANRIGPFTKEAIELLSDLAKRLNTKNVVSEQLPPPQNPKIPEHAKNNKLDGKEKNSAISSEDVVPNKFGEIYSKAPAAKLEIDTMSDEIADMFGGQVAKAPTKSQERAIQKIMNDYDGDATRIKDLARNTIIVSPDKMDSVVAELAQRGANVKVINGATDPLGYSGVNSTIKTQAGIYGEVQVNTPAMIYAKESEPMARALLGDDLYSSIAAKSGIAGGQGHKLYEQWRVLPSSDPGRSALEAQSKAYYEAVRGLVYGN
ncbi:MAG: hypothetical protein K6L75_05455 [Cellvibrionaceae bacterium]